MADFDAQVLDVELAFGTPDPIPATELLKTTSSSTKYFLMRGYRSATNDYETWKAVGEPNSNNPSGLPITDITIQSSWSD